MLRYSFSNFRSYTNSTTTLVAYSVLKKVYNKSITDLFEVQKLKIERHFGLRIDDELLKKFRYVCEYEGRSANGQILYLIRRCVAEYEKENGKINLSQE